MALTVFPRLKGLRVFFVIALGVGLALLVFWVNSLLSSLQEANKIKDLPYGIISFQNGDVYAQDFAYNLLYLRGIQEHRMEHPYRLPDQEKWMRQTLPQGQRGMSHAYSPVAFVLALPLLSVSGRNAYLIYTILCAIGIALLFYFYLLPRVEEPLQIHAFAICCASVCLILAFVVGQSALITTTLVGGLWALLQRRRACPSLLEDISIAALFWALCLKPSVAIIPSMLLLGSRAGRPLAIGTILLLTTWLFLADRYGGWWTGLEDYFHLLNHYQNADFTPFMQRGGETARGTFVSTQTFALARMLTLILNLALLILRWKRLVTPSEQFQGVVWIFLLFSPYLLPSEDWLLCLLVVEGPFFHSRNLAVAAGKLLLLAAILDLRSGLTFPEPVNFPLKCLLFGWILAEWFQARRALIAPNPIYK